MRNVHHGSSYLRLTSAVVACVLAISACLYLVSNRTVEQVVELAPDVAEVEPYHLTRETERRLSANVTVAMPVALDRIRRLELPVTLSRKSLPLQSARLRFADSPCGFRSSQRFLHDHGALVLEPMECTDGIKDGDILKGTLTVELGAPGTLGVGSGASSGARPFFRLARNGQDDGDARYGLARYVVQPDTPTARLNEQIAAVWALPFLQWLTPVLVVMVGVLVGVGGWFCASSHRCRRIAGVGMCALALAVLYAVFVPPFQAADEPDHFLSFARLTDQPELKEGARRLARLGHFERIHFHRWQRFLPDHTREPFPTAWERTRGAAGFHVEDSLMEERSALTTALWKMTAPLAAGMEAAQVLLGLRLMNAVLWAVACMLGAWIIEALAPPARRTFPLFLFVIPCAPFFAMHVSNYAQYTHALTIAASLGLALFLRGRHSDRAGILLGLVGSLILLSATSGAVMLAWVGAVALGRLLVVAGGGELPRASTVRYWGGLFAGCAPFLAFQDSAELIKLAAAARNLMLHFGFPPQVATLLSTAEGAAACLFLAVLGAALLERGILRLGPAMRNARDRFALWSNGLAMGALALLLLYSGFSNFTVVHHGGQTQSAGEYVVHAVWGLLSIFTFREPDVMLSMTFWSGFGWHDVLFAPWVVSLLAGLSGLGLLFAMVRVHGDPARSLRLLVNLAGAFAAGLFIFIVVGYSIDRSLPNAHGRYFLGVYLISLAVAWAGWAPTREETNGRTRHTALPYSEAHAADAARAGFVAWAFLVASAFAFYMAGWEWIFPTLPVPLVWGYAAFVVAALATMRVAWKTHGVLQPRMRGRVLPEPAFLTAVALILVTAFAAAELTVGLPKAAVFGFEFYTVLPTVAFLLTLLYWTKPTLKHVQPWLPAIGVLVAATLHGGSLYFLISRYFG